MKKLENKCPTPSSTQNLHKTIKHNKVLNYTDELKQWILSLFALVLLNTYFPCKDQQ